MSEVLQLGGDTAGLERALKSAQREVVKLKQEVRDLGATSKDHGEQSTRSWDKQTSAIEKTGQAIVSQVKNIGTLTIAFKLFIDQFQRYAQLQEQSSRLAQDAAKNYASLAEVTGGNPAKLSAAIASAQQFSKVAGVDQAAGTRAVFEMLSTGQEPDAAFFAGLSRVAADVPGVIRSTGKFRNIFGKGKLSAEAAYSLALQGAASTPGVSAAQFMEEALAGAGVAEEAGVSPEEFAAAASIVMGRTKSAEMAGTSLKTLISTRLKAGSKGSIADMLREIQTQTGGDVGQAGKLLGAEALQAYLALQDADLAGGAAGIRGAIQGNLAGGVVASALAQPEIAAELRAGRAQQSLDAVKRGIGAPQVGLDAELANLEAAMLTTGRDAWTERQLAKVQSYFMGAGFTARRTRAMRLGAAAWGPGTPFEHTVAEQLREQELTDFPELADLSDTRLVGLARGGRAPAGPGREWVREERGQPGMADDVFREIATTNGQILRTLQRREGPVMDANDGDRHAEN